jgi:hypothetical protein
MPATNAHPDTARTLQTTNSHATNASDPTSTTSVQTQDHATKKNARQDKASTTLYGATQEATAKIAHTHTTRSKKTKRRAKTHNADTNITQKNHGKTPTTFGSYASAPANPTHAKTVSATTEI